MIREMNLTAILLVLPASGWTADSNRDEFKACLHLAAAGQQELETCSRAFNTGCWSSGGQFDLQTQAACFRSFSNWSRENAARAEEAAAGDRDSYEERYLSAAWDLAHRVTEAGCDFLVKTSRSPGENPDEDGLLFVQCYANAIAAEYLKIRALPGGADESD